LTCINAWEAGPEKRSKIVFDEAHKVALSGIGIMYKHLLIATDGSELAGKAISQGLELAKSIGARVTIVTVTEPFSANVPAEVAIVYPLEQYELAVEQSASKILSSASSVAAREGVPCETVHVKDQFAAEAIVATAQNCGCDLIIMASHGRRGFMRFMLGSQAHRVVIQSTISVLICR
jgi:nucleotide-binding universal stress UspA family protein